MFLIHFTRWHGSGASGLEHKSSTVLNVSSDLMKNIRSIAPIAAHEFFHTWNVKRIRPRGLGPFDYTQEVYTNALWFAEGATDYYAHLLLRRAGITDDRQLWSNLANEIQALLNNEARKRISLEEASRKAWQGGSWGYGGLSYYNKGKLVGLLFDLKIRDVTDGRKSLDDVMRLLMRRYGDAPEGFEEDGILKAINQIAGCDLSAEYRSWVQDTDDLPFHDLLRVAGLELVEKRRSTPFFGVMSDSDPETGLPAITGIVKGSEAARTGLQKGDRIISVDGHLMKGRALADAFRNKEAGEQVRLRITRNGSELILTGFMGCQEQVSLEIRSLSRPTGRQMAIRQAWLKGQTGDASQGSVAEDTRIRELAVWNVFPGRKTLWPEPFLSQNGLLLSTGIFSSPACY